MAQADNNNSSWKRIAWFAIIWIASVLALAVVAYSIRLVIGVN